MPMQYLHTAIIALYIIVTIGVMVRVLMDHRQPAKTMAWLLVLTFVPVVGIVFYFFFGQNTRKERLISKGAWTGLPNAACWNTLNRANVQLPRRPTKN